MGEYKYLFGPVPSRRLGRSLGVDLIPYKTCTQDCVFCQLGRTPKKTLTRHEYVPMVDVLDELWKWLKMGGRADHITLSGSGEPTLHSSFGEVLGFVRENSPIKAVPVHFSPNLQVISIKSLMGENKDAATIWRGPLKIGVKPSINRRKIAATSTGLTLEDTVESRFGWCAYFLIIDPDSLDFEPMENPNLALGGAGQAFSRPSTWRIKGCRLS